MIEFEGKEIPITLDEVINPNRTVLLVWDMQNDQAGSSFNKEEFLRTTPPPHCGCPESRCSDGLRPVHSFSLAGRVTGHDKACHEATERGSSK